MLYVLPILALAATSIAVPAHQRDGGLSVKRAEPREVSRLFSRQNTNYPPVNQIVQTSNIPKAWLDKLATIKLPNIPVSTDPQNKGTPQYAGFASDSKDVCSFTYECVADGDIYRPAAGKWAATFDDGVAEGSEALETFLKSQGAMGKATHFMIGSYISYNQDRFRSIASAGGHIASHTWSHNHMTTLTNEQIVGELGWSLQIMSNLNNGRIAKYWRPPYGDVDNRVRAIAKGVFGLETVLWTHDTGDWNLDQGNAQYTVDSVVRTFDGWLADKSQGINSLEHEVRPSQPEAFGRIYSRAKELGWEVANVADTFGMDWYQNAKGPNSTVTQMDVGGTAPSGGSGGASASSAVSASSASASATTSGSAAISSSSSSAGSTSRTSVSASSASSAGSSVSAAAQSVRPSNAASTTLAGNVKSGLLAGVLGLMAVLFV